MCNRYIHTTPAGVCMCKYLLHISGVYVCANIYCTYPGLCTYVIRMYQSPGDMSPLQAVREARASPAAWPPEACIHIYVRVCVCICIGICLYVCMCVCILYIYYVLISPLPCTLMGFVFFTSRDTYVYIHQYHIFMTVYPNTRNICACSRRVD